MDVWDVTLLVGDHDATWVPPEHSDFDLESLYLTFRPGRRYLQLESGFTIQGRSAHQSNLFASFPNLNHPHPPFS